MITVNYLLIILICYLKSLLLMFFFTFLMDNNLLFLICFVILDYGLHIILETLVGRICVALKEGTFFQKAFTLIIVSSITSLTNLD